MKYYVIKWPSSAVVSWPRSQVEELVQVDDADTTIAIWEREDICKSWIQVQCLGTGCYSEHFRLIKEARKNLEPKLYQEITKDDAFLELL